MTNIVITPDLPYFAATADCDWEAAERIASTLGEDHVAAVRRAAAMAEAEALLADIDDGWESVSPAADDTYITAVLGVHALARCRAYQAGTYDCDDSDARAAAHKELRDILAELAS